MDLPHRWWEAIRMATMFISFDELPKEERPPKTIWLDEEKLGAWFQKVEQDRKRRYGSDGKPGDSVLEGETVENKAAKALISG